MNYKQIIEELQTRFAAVQNKGTITVGMYQEEKHTVHVQAQGWFTADEVQVIADVCHAHSLVMQTANIEFDHEYGVLLYNPEIDTRTES